MCGRPRGVGPGRPTPPTPANPSRLNTLCCQASLPGSRWIHCDVSGRDARHHQRPRISHISMRCAAGCLCLAADGYTAMCRAGTPDTTNYAVLPGVSAWQPMDTLRCVGPGRPTPPTALCCRVSLPGSRWIRRDVSGRDARHHQLRCAAGCLCPAADGYAALCRAGTPDTTNARESLTSQRLLPVVVRRAEGIHGTCRSY